MAENYDINYEDERFAQVETDKTQALSDLENTYAGMISESDKYYQQQIDASQAWADKQTQLQQEQTDFAIEQIEQNKEQAQKDYIKEQSGAYVDWQKQSNQYGANAEAMAANGLTNTGYSESSQVSMYNTYQNRVATARESYNLAVQNFNNSITEARLQNNSVLAEIAFEALQTQLELSLQGFQYKNQLVQEQSNQKIALEESYYNRYLDVLNQMNTENALAEEIRQYNESMAEEQRQYDQNYQLQLQQYEEGIRQWQAEYDLQLQQYEENIRQFDEQIAYYKEKDAKNYALEIQQLELQKAQMEESIRQWEAEMAFEREQWEYELAQASSKSSSNNNVLVDGSGSSGSNATVQSILDVAGVVSGETLAAMVASGEVKETKNSNGETVFVRNNTQNSELNSKTLLGSGLSTAKSTTSKSKASTSTNKSTTSTRNTSSSRAASILDEFLY